MECYREEHDGKAFECIAIKINGSTNELCGTRRQIQRLLSLRDDKHKMSAYVQTFLKEKVMKNDK